MFLPISLASFLLNRKAAVFIISWGLLTSLIIFYVQSQGILSFNLSAKVSFTEWLVFATILGLIGWVQNLYVGNVHDNLIQVKDQESALADSQMELENVRSTLKDYTATVERRTRYLEAAAEVGQAATSIYSLEELLPQVVNFISERFEFYQAGIFLLDDVGEYAIMRAASSEGGRQMLARNHKLKVGAEGIVGYVTGSGQARIALDVGEDAVHFDNPELPHTRSEMALPLFYSGRLFGALDVQSTEPNAFSDEDVSALRVLADQVSMAINNAQLFEQLQNSLESERLAYGEISSEAWKKLTRSKENWGYKYSNNNLVSVGGNWSEDMAEAAYMGKSITSNKENKPTLAIPIRIGNHVAGVIRLRKDINHTDWTSDERGLVETLIDRLGQALESARLFQSSQKLAAKEQLTSEISSHIRQTLDIDTVLQTAAKELGEAFKAKEVVIRMNPKSS
jgi:GAF domain-containing protein